MPVAIGRGGLISSRLYSIALSAHEQGNSMKQHRLAAAVALGSMVLAGGYSQTRVELKTQAQNA
ncbi:FKBP-type peptidyl-prolyl cis-trans isomerase, partial [Pseudomonas sp. NPDC087598]